MICFPSLSSYNLPACTANFMHCLDALCAPISHSTAIQSKHTSHAHRNIVSNLIRYVIAIFLTKGTGWRSWQEGLQDSGSQYSWLCGTGYFCNMPSTSSKYLTLYVTGSVCDDTQHMCSQYSHTSQGWGKQKIVSWARVCMRNTTINIYIYIFCNFRV